MKIILLAGGLGTRITEHTGTKPKPMIEIGGRPILWHLMKYFTRYGHREFVIALGHLSEYVKQWFFAYQQLAGSKTLELMSGRVVRHAADQPEDWIVHLMDTGLGTMTGGRIGRVASLVRDETFILTYGDGLSDVNLDELVAFHKKHGRMATITAVRPPARFGGLVFGEETDKGAQVTEFTEKPQVGEGWINGGFMVLEPGILEYVDSDATSLEHDVLESVARAGQLMAFRHEGFWQCMDTVRDLKILETHWQGGHAPWKA